MPRYRIALPCLVAVLVALGAHRAGAARSDWEAPYTPTRIEWLAVTLSSTFATDCDPVFGVMEKSQGCVSTKYVATGPDTITIFVDSYGAVPAVLHEKKVSQARGLVATVAKSLYGVPPPKIVEQRSAH